MALVNQQRSLYPWLMKDYVALAKDFLNNRLHHAVLLSAAEGLGVEQLAQRLVELIHCENLNSNKACGVCQQCLLHNSHSHADYYFVSCLEGKAQISIEQIRQLSKKAQGTGLVSQKRIVVIDCVELMTESATNALLKILEEPPAHVYFILTTSKVQHLVPTIISRCFKVLIASPDIRKTHGWLVKKTQKDVNIDYLSLLGNSPLKALEAIDSNLLPQLSLYVESLNKLYVSWANKQFNESFCHGVDVVELFEKMQKDKAINTNIDLLISITQRFNQYVLKQQFSIESGSQGEELLSLALQNSLATLSPKALIHFSDRLVSLNRILSQNSGVNISTQLGRYINEVTENIIHSKEWRDD